MQFKKTNTSQILHAVLSAYRQGPKSNAEMYETVNHALNIAFNENKPVGQTKTIRNIDHRKYRWAQQTLKTQGLIEKCTRGTWQTTKDGKFALTKTLMDHHMIAANTELGVIIWGDARKVFKDVITDHIHLCLTSIPYFSVDRSYGTKSIRGDLERFEEEKQKHIEFLLSVFEPICNKMVPGANLAINIPSNTVFPRGHGERSDFVEDFTTAVRKKLGMCLMDRLIWLSEDKQPRGYYTTHARTHLANKYEFVLWFTNEPEKCLANNRRVLVPYKEQMRELIDRGGSKNSRKDADYNTTRAGSFSRDNGGSIPGNVLSFPTNCSRNRITLEHARSMNLSPHGAVYPYKLADFLVRWLCPPNGVTVDPFGGTLNTAEAAERAGLFWYTTELHWEYIRPSLIHFQSFDGYWANPLFKNLDHQLIGSD